jgi:hypothetical protein
MNTVQEISECVNVLQQEITDDTAKTRWKAISKLSNIARSPMIEPPIRARALFELYSHDSQMGLETLIVIRDSLDLSDGDIQESHIDVLRKIIEQPVFPSSQRYLCAVSCYNSDLFECNEFFITLMQDCSVLIEDRVESSKFLYYTQNEDYLEKCLMFLKKVIDDTTLDSAFRYQTIACFIGDTGISAKYQTNRLRVYGNDEFVYPLQHSFFFNEKNNVRFRLLSGQHLLQLENIDASIHSQVEQTLLQIAKNVSIVEDSNDAHNIRADAADILMRMAPTSEVREKAGQIIAELGDEDNINPLEQNFYSNKQNVHLTTNTDEYIEKLVVDSSLGNVQAFDDVYSTISNLINEMDLTYSQRIHAFKSLNRISIDSAKFTKFKLTQAKVLCYVWRKIVTHAKNLELKTRLVEELIDMADTCSTGHCSRLVNVFSAYEEGGVMITIEKQLQANITARFNALVRKDEDCDNLVCGMMPDDEYHSQYIDFIIKHSDDVKNELKKEFVDEGYMSKSKFEQLFTREVERLTSQ